MIKSIETKLSEIFARAAQTIKEPNLLEIVNRNFVFSQVNMNANVVICGINPSFRKTETNLNAYSYNFEDLEQDKYFGKFHNLIEAYKKDKIFTYIDLFYQRHTEQSEINNFIGNNEAVDFICEQLIVTQGLIEQIKPKFIFVFNRQAANFWGINNRQNLSNVWLGYKFEKTANENIFRICGFEDCEQRVNNETKATNLEGTLIYFSKFIGYRTPKKDIEQIKLDMAELLSHKQ